MHAACQTTPQLLPLLGLSDPQQGMTSMLAREESLALHALLAEGVRQGREASDTGHQQALASAPWQGVLSCDANAAAPAFSFSQLGEGGQGVAPDPQFNFFQPPP